LRKNLIVRTNVPTLKNIKQQGCLIYDENENFLDYDYIKNNIQLIPLLHIEGIKFTSKSFKIEITIKQIMVLSLEDKIKSNCLIKQSNNNQKNDETPQEKPQDNDNKEEADDDDEDEEKEDEDEEEYQEEDEEEETKEEKEEIKEEKKEEKEEIKEETLDNLQEYNLDIENIENIETNNISLKSPKDVYYEIYKAALKKAQQFRKAALEANLEAKNIKIKYNLDELSDLSELSDLE
jgi:flagellar biosynthesis GTPase FlhF